MKMSEKNTDVKRGRPDHFGSAIVSFIKSKPWNGRVVSVGDIHMAYSIERRNRGKLASNLQHETSAANIQIQNMIRAGKLVRVSRGKYTTPDEVVAAKSRAAKKAK
jgi:hypothetical protein